MSRSSKRVVMWRRERRITRQKLKVTLEYAALMEERTERRRMCAGFAYHSDRAQQPLSALSLNAVRCPSDVQLTASSSNAASPSRLLALAVSMHGGRVSSPHDLHGTCEASKRG